MAAKTSNIQRKKINDLRKKLRIKNLEIPINHSAANRLLTELQDKYDQAINACPVIIHQTQPVEREACCTPGCIHTTSTRSQYCEYCKEARKKGTMESTTRFSYTPKECKKCGEEFTPVGPRQVFCTTECKKEFHKSKETTNVADDIVEEKICGLVGCENKCLKGTRKFFKYCCDEHKTIANKHYKNFEKSKITFETLKSLVREVYLRRGNLIRHQEKISNGELKSDKVEWIGQQLYRVAFERSKTESEATYNLIIEQCRNSSMNGDFSTEFKIPINDVVFKMVIDQLNTTGINVVSDKTDGVATFLLDWSMCK